MCSFWWKLLLPPQSVSHFFTTFYFPLLLLFSLSGTSSTVCLLPAFLLECGIWSFFFYHHYSANENLLFVLAAFLSVCLAAIPDSMSQCVLSFPLALFFLSFPFFFFCLAQFYCGAVFFLFFFFLQPGSTQRRQQQQFTALSAMNALIQCTQERHCRRSLLFACFQLVPLFVLFSFLTHFQQLQQNPPLLLIGFNRMDAHKLACN